ncbi:MAG: Nudix family hydrolase [Gammaproteobacteria bacterium]|nr:Nudix family hydrolase [Gammaproteobacteria bacterium]
MPTTAHEARIHVAVGIVLDSHDRVLIAQRRSDGLHARKWEFPGGKFEPGESAIDALRRELHEELGICVLHAYPLITIAHDYGSRKVLLGVWRVTKFTGTPTNRENQNIQWVIPSDLWQFDLLAANRRIAQAIRLPSLYLITAAWRYGTEATLRRLEQALRAGARLVQLREKQMHRADLLSFADEVISLCHGCGAEVLLNADASLVKRSAADGIHLDSSALKRCETRPLPQDMWVGASCHDATELERAAQIPVDFAVLGPVFATQSHPNADPLSWQRFSALTETATFPVFAIGGMNPDHVSRARSAGAQGLAMISGIWEAPSVTQVLTEILQI